MGFEYYGRIEVVGLPKGEKAVENAIKKLLENSEDNNFEQYKKEGYLEQLYISDNQLVSDGGGDYDDMSAYNDIFYCVSDEIVNMYPECTMHASFKGCNMNSDDEWALIMDLKNHHVRRIDIEGSCESICCPNPDCEEVIISVSEFEFDTDYECEYCGRKISADEAINTMRELVDVEEYDV